MYRQSLRAQWGQLIVLSSVHFLVDMFGNMLPAILPEIRQYFSLSLSLGSFILFSLMLTANGVQMLTGHMRPKKTQPLFLHVGLVLAAGICLMAVAPRSGVGVALVIGLGIVSGCGIAVAHPEGLRAVHVIDRISPRLSTAVFMTSGFLGFASGGAIASLLVKAHGLRGLYPLALCPVAGILAVLLTKVRLSVEDDTEKAASEAGAAPTTALPFWRVLLAGLPAGTATTIVLFLLPTYLDELGFDLSFRGLSAAMFGWGGTVGPFIWALAARKKGDLPCAFYAFLVSVPFMILYLVFVRHAAAVWLLFGVGFCSMSAYILTITLARQASGLNLGQRMAFIVGGTWGIADVVFLAFVPIADRLGTGFVLKLMPVGYVLSTVLTLSLMRAYPAAGRGRKDKGVVDIIAEEHPPV